MELYSNYLDDHFNVHKLSPDFIASTSTPYATHIRMGIYESPQIGMWNDPYKVGSSMTNNATPVVESPTKIETELEDIPQDDLGLSPKYDTDGNKPADKNLRRLAQNREAARKSRLRKKAYIQQLESSRIKLSQLEQELDRARQQSVYISGALGDSSPWLTGAADSVAIAFDMEYARWIEQQDKLTTELRTALQSHVPETDLQRLVHDVLSHYDRLFWIKEAAARSNVFYIMSGMWRSAAERVFQWIAGFRPSELLKVLTPHLGQLTEQQAEEIGNLRRSSQQAEDALWQGLEKLQQTLAEALSSHPLGACDAVDYSGRMVVALALDQLEELVNFVTEADNLRRQTLLQMKRILNTPQAARALLALGDYFQRLRALSSLWVAHHREAA